MKYIIVLLLLTIGNVATAEQKFPEAWRTPTAEEIHDDYDWRSADPQRHLAVEADFDGDGQVDTAKLLINDIKNTMGLFVQLSSSANFIKLDETDEKGWIQVIGISRADPGYHKTACGKGYFECGPGEPEVLHLENPGIDYFKIESANSFFYWDEASNSFKRVWMSD
jgi:hypothetical protein